MVVFWLTLLLTSAVPAEKESGELQARSLLGQDLYSPPLDPEVRQRLEENLARARARLQRSPWNHDNLIWVGRRLAYLGRYKEAVEVFSNALERYPDSARLLRHRGHRYITLRRFDDAIGDLERAAQLTHGQRDRIEADGAPNALNIPTSTLQTNIYYHLGLAYYLKGHFEKAAEAYHACMKRSKNDDMLVATSHWLYMTLRRSDKDEEAESGLENIGEDLRVIENSTYYELLMMYKGSRTPEEVLGEDSGDLRLATAGYGVANWYYYSGNPAKAEEILKKIHALPGWAAFGYIAAEADLARGL